LSSPLIGTAADLRPTLREHLADLEPPVQDEVINQVLTKMEQVPPPKETTESRRVEKDLFGETYYAIHDEDLNLLEVCAGIATAATSLLSNPLPLLGELVAFLFLYRRKRVPLTAKQATVLIALRKSPPGGWRVEELVARLPLRSPPSREGLRKILKELKEFTIMDGTDTGPTTAFVAEKDGRWRAVDV
jgi:hypothetical protein